MTWSSMRRSSSAEAGKLMRRICANHGERGG